VDESYTYNTAHQILTQTDNLLGRTTTYTYNGAGQLETLTDPDQISTTYFYNAQYQLERIARDGRTLATFTYDAIGRIATQTDATGLGIAYSYDDLDHITTVTYPDGKTEQMEYNGAASPHLLTRMVSRGGQQTVIDYDNRGNLAQLINNEGNRLRYGYDFNTNMVSFTDQGGAVSDFTYTSGDQLRTRIWPDDTTHGFTYDDAGRIRTATNARGQRATSYYDAHDNLLAIDYQDENTPDVSFIYDDFDRLIEATDGTGTTLFTYNAGSQLISIDGPLANDTLTYTYDSLGRVETLSVENGRTITYQYDRQGRLTSVDDGDAPFTYSYPASSASPMLDTLTHPSGVMIDYTYDSLNRLTGQQAVYPSGADLTEITFEYDDHDQRSRETRTGFLPPPVVPDSIAQFSYDEMNRITAADPPPRGFSFDLDGNLTGGYTSEGFPFTAVYDQENRLINLSYTDGTGAAIEIRYTYRFDHFLAKIERFTDGVATGATHIIRNGGLAIQDRDGSNTVVREYLWGAGMGGGIGGLLQLRQNGAVYTYNYDGNGNVIGLLDEAGELVQQYRYDVYGMIEAQSGAIDQPFTFSTKRLDPATGLVYYGYRYYLPNLARWLTRDPIGEEGGVNLYGFVNQDPVSLVDPLGLKPRFQPAGPDQGCEYYKERCECENDQYACKAYDCCKAFGDDNTSNCIRGCLVAFDKRNCQNLTGEARNRCRRIEHWDCYDRCLGHGKGAKGILAGPPEECLDAMEEVGGMGF
jgi:RHS repeat-associated protein